MEQTTQTHLAHGPGSLQHQEEDGQRDQVLIGTVNGTELMSLMNMAPNGSSNPYIYREQRRKLHKNLYVHRHPRPWTAPDQSGKNGEQGNTELGLRTTDSMDETLPRPHLNLYANQRPKLRMQPRMHRHLRPR